MFCMHECSLRLPYLIRHLSNYSTDKLHAMPLTHHTT